VLRFLAYKNREALQLLATTCYKASSEKIVLTITKKIVNENHCYQKNGKNLEMI
jgi:hypothetical protein